MNKKVAGKFPDGNFKLATLNYICSYLILEK